MNFNISKMVYSVLCSTLQGFIDINSRKISMTYTQSTHLINFSTPNDYTVPSRADKCWAVKRALRSSFKSASTIGPGRGGTSHLTDFDETWPV